MAAVRIPLWLKISWTIWVAVWAPIYWRYYGAQNLLYFCDLGNFLVLGALWLESSLLFSWQACVLLIFQSLFAIDLAGACLTGRHFVGGSEYMFDRGIPLPLRLMSLFHLAVPPLLLWAVRRLGYDPRGWRCATLESCVVVPINYFWRPQYNINWAHGLFAHEQHTISPPLYLAGYLVAVPLLIFWPTHKALQWWAGSVPKLSAERQR